MHESGPTDNLAYRFPVSVKGVVVRDGRVVLLKNGREEWELPGGKLESDESPPECVAREVREELSLAVGVGPILDSWVYRIGPGVDVLIVSYGCFPEPQGRIRNSTEHKAVGYFSPEEIDGLNMPEGYKHSIRSWFRALSAPGGQSGGLPYRPVTASFQLAETNRSVGNRPPRAVPAPKRERS
jgi:8-oxo-dGTP pyrophosphatase MutT (NUDIX family)